MKFSRYLLKEKHTLMYIILSVLILSMSDGNDTVRKKSFDSGQKEY
ncbi:hypothetical protein BH10BAC5_BH10BAC5_24890 [soil metagenome]